MDEPEDWTCPLCDMVIPVWSQTYAGQWYTNTATIDKHMKAHARGEI